VCAEGGPEGHEQLRHIVAPQHIEKDYLDTRCSNWRCDVLRTV